ncbi:MAG TPA: hypothetical protein PLO06_02060 [Methanoregulaceae archaeon]|nr:hypothetical protein [Methanoregulaceae archaeon]
MAGISSEELGRRRFQVLRDKAAEDALEKIRKSMAGRGRQLTSEESATIRDVLREIWSGIDQHAWEKFSFTKLSEDDIRSTVLMGKGGGDRAASVRAMADTLKNILIGKME